MDTGYPVEVCADDAWTVFSSLRRHYAPVAAQLLYWTIAAPGPWSGKRQGSQGWSIGPTRQIGG